MEVWKTCPPVLQRRFYFTLLAGTGSVMVSLIIYLAMADHIPLLLSGVIFICCLFRSLCLLHAIRHKDYETVTGTCVGISTPQFRKYRQVKLMDENSTESTLLLGRQSRVRIGMQYRFYFQKNPSVLGNDYLDAALSTNQFLGFEELGEYH